MNEQNSDLLRQISRYIFIGVAALLVLLLLLALLRVSVGFWLWSTVETWAKVRLGLDTDAAQLVTVIGVSLITLLLPTLAYFFLWGKKHLYATGLVVGGQILIFLLVSTVGSGVCFDRQTGKSLCYYADIPGKGRVFSRSPGFDTEIGVEFKEYTREVALASRSSISNSNSSVSGSQTVSIPMLNYTSANWNEYGPGVSKTSANQVTELWMRASGSISYTAALGETKGNLIVTARLSSELNNTTSTSSAYSSDVTLVVNGQKQKTQTVIQDNASGAEYQWTVPNEVLRVGSNEITFRVGDGRYSNGLVIYSPIQLKFQ